MKAEVLTQHRWLQRLLGEWVYEHELPAEAGKPARKLTGKETIRPLGDLWVLAEGQGEMPDGNRAHTLMTIGYDPQKAAFVGTWVGSMMTHLWIYEGSLDTQERVLTLNSEGPSFTEMGKMAKYQDIITFVTDDHRMLTSRVLGPDGAWTQFMEAHYRRKP